MVVEPRMVVEEVDEKLIVRDKHAVDVGIIELLNRHRVVIQAKFFV